MRELGKGSDVSKFNAGRNLIEWNWLGAGMAGDFELYRGTEYYTLTVNCDLRDFKNGAGENLASYNCDILRTLLSFITPNVNQVFDYLYNGFYGSGTAFNTSKYESVGDCKIKLDPYFVVDKDNTVHHVKFYIKPN